MSAKWYPEGYTYPPISRRVINAPAQTNPSTGSPSSGRGSTTQSPASRSTNDISSRPQHATDLDANLIEGVTYFKIGEPVCVRRYHIQCANYSAWVPGRVERPIFIPGANENETTTHRSYMVSYKDPMTSVIQERSFSPFFREIANVDAIKATLEAGGLKPIFYAFLPTPERWGHDVKTKGIWTPVGILNLLNEDGFRVRVLAGTCQDEEISGVQLLLPHTHQCASECRRQGYQVMGEGTRPFI